MAQKNREPVVVFISYSHKDVCFARELECRLKREGMAVWMDERIVSCICLLKGIDNELATDRDGVVQVEIAKALRKVGDLRAIPALLKLREREEEKKREDYQKKREGKEKKFYEPAYNAVCAALKDLANRYS